MANTRYDIPYVQPHHSAWRYRRVVPADVRSAIGKRTWIKTFRKSTNLARLEAEATRLAREHDAVIARARAGEVIDKEVIKDAEAEARQTLAKGRAETLDMLTFVEDIGGVRDDDRWQSLNAPMAALANALENGGSYKAPRAGMRLSQAYERDKSIYGGSRNERAVEGAVESFVALLGDLDIFAITRGQVQSYVNGCQKAGHKSSTIERRLTPLRAMLNRAFDDAEHSGRNPFSRPKLPKAGGSLEDRMPLNRAMIERVDSYIESNRRLGRETKNLLRLLRNTGAGPAEVGGLAVGDVILDADIPHIWIRPNAVRDRLKNQWRDRRIPLIGQSLDGGADALRCANVRAGNADPAATPLFGSYGISGRGANSISAKLAKAMRAAGVPASPRLVPYSYRHSLVAAMRVAEINEDTRNYIEGHSRRGVSGRYGSRHLPLDMILAAMERSLSHLGEVDPADYRPGEWLDA